MAVPLDARDSGANFSRGELDGEGQRNPYCQATIPPKIMKLRKSFQKYVKA